MSGVKSMHVVKIYGAVQVAHDTAPKVLEKEHAVLVGSSAAPSYTCSFKMTKSYGLFL